MFLKSLEIRGFKSFADKTELKFKNGVTAVVGPNGSGKSNISDAVRWVLGEQSVKSLRGGKMEDVIFAGTMYRKGLSLAQVSITLDNSDYQLPIEFSDVTVSRRLYRSGESEYYINNTLCRLKDIQELFMDTGIGKEGYSIIGQGKIEAILSGRPEERRNLIEEAAGIVKFKTRKEEAEKKLANTEQNLVRINDILSTYEERLEPLKIEHEKAKKFLELSEQLKEKEVSILIHLIEKNELKINDYKAKICKIDEELNKLYLQKDTIKDSLDKLQKELEDHEQQSINDKENYYSCLNNKQSIISENQVITERISTLTDYIERYEKEKEEIIQKLNILSEQRNNLEIQLREHQIDKNKNDEKIKSLEFSLEEINKEVNLGEETLNTYNQELIELLRRISDYKNQITSAKINQENLNKRQEQLKAQYESFNTSLTINTTTISELEKELIKLKEEISKGENRIKEYKKQVSIISKNYADIEKVYKEISSNNNRLEANHNALINLEKHYEGYNRAAKALMMNIENNKIPVAKDKTFLLGNIIKVPDHLVDAIEVALGGAVSDIITEDENIAKALIEHLKVNNIGRATFLPLNIIEGKKIKVAEDITKMEGYIGIASELIGYKKEFEAAVNYVLGRTIICNDMDNALKIARRASFTFKIVTLAGDVVNPGGSLTGGSQQRKSANILGRKKEIKDLEIKIEEGKDRLTNLSVELESLKSRLKELDNLILNEKDQIHFNEIDITKVQGRISAILEDSEKLKKNAKVIYQEIQSIEEKLQQYDGSIINIENQIDICEKKEKEIRSSIDQLQTATEQKRKEIETTKEELIKLKIDKAQRDEVLNNKIRELERIAKDIENYISRKEQLLEEINQSKQSIVESSEVVKNNNIKLEELSDKVKALEEKFKEYEVIKIELKDNIKKKNQENEELVRSISIKDSEKHRLELNMTKYESDKSNYLGRLNDEYNLTLAEAQKYKREISNSEEVKREVAELKTEITALGVVNVGAIEEYEQLTEKYNFMSSQREDLTKAINELNDVINEMISKMKEIFNENFQKLRGYFNETFRELFKGGSADLILGEGDELSANIDINVQPPGKKLQNINLMSGGEKGLSAIALLFAILKMKPTPFCILDEIEAALDDANVARYAEFLKSFSKNIQFIVITHRKGTMEVSDVLYGVTMEEKGVSKVVSVDLSKA
ncbi:MAG: chromosome segregation protein SMC [Clostridiales bacterium]|nr:chromosome segregation protein SMC [Clostridiales bacterium]